MDDLAWLKDNVISINVRKQLQCSGTAVHANFFIIHIQLKMFLLEDKSFIIEPISKTAPHYTDSASLTNDFRVPSNY